MSVTMHPVHPTRKHHPHSKLLLFEAFLFLAFTIILFLVIGSVTNANPGAVLVAFMPALVFAIALIALIQTDHFEVNYTWMVFAIILVIAGILYVVTPVASGFDLGTILLMNAVLMGIALAVMHSSYTHEPTIHEHELHRHAEIHAAHRAAEKQPKHEVHEHHVVHHHVAKQEPLPVKEEEDEVSTVVHSIEDKVKALNFVIGRVYSVYKGGSERMRNRVRVDKDWYGEFNAIGAHDTKRRRAEALVLLSKIKDRLDLLEKTERDVFGEEHGSLRNLSRSADGSDTVIDVLVRNDKDPVRRYYDGARGFCEEGIKKLSAGQDPHA